MYLGSACICRPVLKQRGVLGRGVWSAAACGCWPETISGCAWRPPHLRTGLQPYAPRGGRGQIKSTIHSAAHPPTATSRQERCGLQMHGRCPAHQCCSSHDRLHVQHAELRPRLGRMVPYRLSAARSARRRLLAGSCGAAVGSSAPLPTRLTSAQEAGACSAGFRRR